jgi:hypothetical protein
MPYDVAAGIFRQCTPFVTRLTLVVTFFLPVQIRDAVPGHDVVLWCSSCVRWLTSFLVVRTLSSRVRSARTVPPYL